MENENNLNVTNATEDTVTENVTPETAATETVASTSFGEQAEVVSESAKENAEAIKELVSVVDAHFLAVRNLLKFNKDKDTNVNKLTNALQTYRDGFENKYFKSVALNLIGYREDCKKSIREFKERGLSVQEATKYLNYLVYDYEDLLENLNVRVDGDAVYYNNKPVNAGFDKKIKTCEIEEFVLPDAPVLEDESLKGVTEYLKNVETYIVEVLKSNAGLDNVLKVYIDNSLLYEEGVHQVMLYPIIASIAKLYNAVKTETEERINVLTEENATLSFVECSTKVVDALEEILLKCTVTIDSEVGDTYDPQKHRLLKIVYTDNPEENGKIVERYTDCYAMDSKVIYPQKADVMKYQEKK